MRSHSRLKLAKDYKPHPITNPIWDGNKYVRLNPEKQSKRFTNTRAKSLVSYSFQLGKSRTFFHEMQRSSPDTFKLIDSLGNGDLFKGYNLLKEQHKQKEQQLYSACEYFKRVMTLKQASLELYGIVDKLPSYVGNIKRRGGIKTIGAYPSIDKILEYAREKGWKDD